MSALTKLQDVTLLTLDVTNSKQIAATVEVVGNETGGTLYILINNTGENHFMLGLDIDIAKAKWIFNTNFWSALAVSESFTPLVIKAEGSVVSITLIAGHCNVPYTGLHSASKRSLEIFMETLWLEMQPFNITVLSVVTGAVQTKGNSYFEDWKLPKNTLFKPIETTIARRAQGHDGVKQTDRMDYANKVASEIIRGASDKMWCGANADGAKFEESFMPQSLMDSSVIKGCEFEELAKNV